MEKTQECHLHIIQNSLENIRNNLYQLDAMVSILMNADLAVLPPLTLMNYFWGMSNIVANALLISEI